MKWLTALLLTAPMLANGACYTHPDNGVTYCTNSQECPSGTSWNAPTQACVPQTQPQTPTEQSATCRIMIDYASDKPGEPFVYPVDGRYCDIDGITDAILAALARFRGL